MADNEFAIEMRDACDTSDDNVEPTLSDNSILDSPSTSSTTIGNYCNSELPPYMQRVRQMAIYYVFNHMLHAPPREQWKEYQIIPKIMNLLGIPQGSYGLVAATLEKISSANSKNEIFVGGRNVSTTNGRKKLISDGDNSSNIIANCISSGLI